jgi:hypothetical protein
MSNHLLARVGLDAGVKASTPLITYVDPAGSCRIECCTGLVGRKSCPRCHRERGKSFSARARRQRRRVISQLDALPIALRARAAGLHGAALRAYIAAVEALDGAAALGE